MYIIYIKKKLFDPKINLSHFRILNTSVLPIGTYLGFLGGIIMRFLTFLQKNLNDLLCFYIYINTNEMNIQYTN